MSQFDEAFSALPDIMRGHSVANPERDAVICGSHRLKWGEFGRRLDQVAAALAAAGLRKGDRVAVIMGNGIETLLAMFGAFSAGACTVPISPMLTVEQISGLLADCSPSFVFASEQTRAIVEPSRGSLPTIAPDRWISVGFEQAGWQTWSNFLSRVPGPSTPKNIIRGGDPFCIIYSSGTTGLPKGILHSHASRVALAQTCALEMRFDPSARALTTTSLYSMGTFLMLLPTFLVGGTLVVLEQFSPANFFAAVEGEGVTHTFLVPPQFLMLLADPGLDRADLVTLRCALSAGSTLRSETRDEVLRRMTTRLYELYGTSEGVASMMKPEQRVECPGSVGQPMVGHRMKTIDNDGRVLPPGEPGEIVGYSSSLMLGYYNKVEATQAAMWVDEDGRQHFRTGDIGRIDARQFVTIVDRKKDMIISGGFNIYPVDIERVIAGHEAVFDVTVIGVPHPKWDETPLALVILRPGAELAGEELMRWTNSRVARHQRVSAVEFRDEFPRNALGKVLKRELRAERDVKKDPD